MVLDGKGGARIMRAPLRILRKGFGKMERRSAT
jgi:hypothetical protein